jgi:hypothetical protein
VCTYIWVVSVYVCVWGGVWVEEAGPVLFFLPCLSPCLEEHQHLGNKMALDYWGNLTLEMRT